PGCCVMLAFKSNFVYITGSDVTDMHTVFYRLDTRVFIS
uniref:Uncharacterized protein n=1 Tax=Amphimedon queenslandica TaxID=400682 RepID=A0A1X7TL11_AMPQE